MYVNETQRPSVEPRELERERDRRLHDAQELERTQRVKMRGQREESRAKRIAQSICATAGRIGVPGK